MVEWVDELPAKVTKVGKWKFIAEQLRERPGTWAMVVESDRAAKIHAGRTSLKAHGCEVAQYYDSEANITKLYARWPK